jgi:renalase
MTSVGVVGAGGAAAAATYVIDETVPEVDVTILEKSAGLCGRAATRRHRDLTYDYGANYVKSDDARVVELLTETLSTEGLVDVTEPIYTFDGAGTVSEGRAADDHKWTYREGLTQLAKRLLDRTDVTVHAETRIERIVNEADQWRLRDATGRVWGPFEVLLVNPPAPQTADLLADADWDAQAGADLITAARDVGYRSIWSGVLHYGFELDRPYYALVNTDDDHEVGWFAREACKPGHVPQGETLLVVQASPDWSAEHFDDDPADNLATLADHAADVLADNRLSDPDWTDHQGWRYALPENGVRDGAVDAAASHDLYPVGDWVAGEARLHAALRNGLDTGEEIALSLA